MSQIPIRAIAGAESIQSYTRAIMNKGGHYYRLNGCSRLCPVQPTTTVCQFPAFNSILKNHLHGFEKLEPISNASH